MTVINKIVTSVLKLGAASSVAFKVWHSLVKYQMYQILIRIRGIPCNCHSASMLQYRNAAMLHLHMHVCRSYISCAETLGLRCTHHLQICEQCSSCKKNSRMAVKSVLLIRSLTLDFKAGSAVGLLVNTDCIQLAVAHQHAHIVASRVYTLVYICGVAVLNDCSICCAPGP